MDAELTKRPPEIPAWADIPADMKPILAREMEVYAGFLEHADHHVGRLIDALDKLKELDNTLIYYIIGDNGASAEGSLNGCFNELLMLNGITGVETPKFLKAHIDEFGGPHAYNHYAVGWAHAMDTPYQWTKQVASHWGGTRNGTIVHWPKGIKAKGEIRSHSIMLSISHPRFSMPPSCRIRPSSTALPRSRWRASRCGTRSTTQKRLKPTRRNTSKCSSTAASITKAGRPSPGTARRG